MVTYFSKRVYDSLSSGNEFDYKSSKRLNENYIASKFCNYIGGDGFKIRESPDALIKKGEYDILVEITSCEYINFNKIPKINKFNWELKDRLLQTTFAKSINGHDITVLLNPKCFDKIKDVGYNNTIQGLFSEITHTINSYLQTRRILKSPNFELKMVDSSKKSYLISVFQSEHIEDSYGIYYEEISKIISKKSLKSYKTANSSINSKLILIIEVNPLCFQIKELLDYFEDKKFINSESFDEIYIFSKDNFYKID